MMKLKILCDATNIHVINVSILVKDVKYMSSIGKLKRSIICPNNCPSRVTLPSTPFVSLCLDRFGRVSFLLEGDLRA